MEAHRGHGLSRCFDQGLHHGIGRFQCPIGRGALANFFHLVGPFPIYFSKDDVVLKHREFPEQLELFRAALGSGCPSRTHHGVSTGFRDQ